MADFVNAIAGNPWYLLITIAGTLITFIAAVIGGLSTSWRGFYRRLPAPTSGKQVSGQAESGKPIKLRLQHRLKPSRYPLKGKRVTATGNIWKRDYVGEDVPTMKLYAFPHDVDVLVECEFAKEYATDLHALDNLRLVSVVGTAVENLEIADRLGGHSCQLRLKNCEVERAGFVDWMRFQWNLLF